MIKTIKKHFLAMAVPVLFAIIGFFSSCNFLDIDPYITDLFTLDTVFHKKEYVQKYLLNVYSYIFDDGANMTPWTTKCVPWTPLTDECVVTYKRHNHIYNYFCNNEMTSENTAPFDYFNYLYEGIRKANTFIQNVNNCQEVSAMQRSEWIGEADFIKANLYFELMLMYGPVPIVPDSPVDFDTPIEKMMIERSTWDECSKYVQNLLEEAYKLLPTEVRDNGEIGRPTRNSVLAVMSRLTLYTASPLYNGDNKEFADFKNNEGVPYLNPNKDIEKWAVAAAVAKRLVQLKPNDLYTVPKMDNTPNFPVPEAEQANFPNGVGGIDPYHSYLDMFDGECELASDNKEILFCRQSSAASGAEVYTTPRILGNCWESFNVPQNLVDAYYMADGRSIDNSSTEFPYELTGYTANDSTWSGDKLGDGFTLLSGTRKWYANREMRFYATIAFNNSYYPSTSTPPDKIDKQDGKVGKFFRDSKSGKEYAQTGDGGEAEEYVMTGYLCRKYVHYEDSWQPGGRVKRKYNVLYRMAEVYLNYVEAMNELDKTYSIGDVSVSRDQVEMKRCFNLIRHRAGLPGITDADVADKDKMRDLILKERRIEMAWEGRRYHDLRRLKKAVIYENAPVKGCDVNAPESKPEVYYTIIRCKERSWLYKVFTNRQTFFPIPKSEIDRNPNLDQMPGF